jgi:hypothetical protein
MAQGLAVGGTLIGVADIVNDARGARQTVYGGADDNAEFVNQSLLQKCAVGPTAALKQQRTNAEVSP